MKKLLFPLTAILIIFFAAFKITQSSVTHSSISFKIKNLGIYTNGTIGGLQADIHFKPNDPSTSTIVASVDMHTLTTGNSSRDEHLKSEDFFDLDHYPAMKLQSVTIKHNSGNIYTGKFNLTIKDKTRPVEIPFTCVEKGSSQTFNGTFKINRRDYNVGSNSMILSDEVTIIFDTTIID